MNMFSKILSAVLAGAMVFGTALEAAAPQHNAGGTLFLVNRQYMISSAYEPPELSAAQVPGSVREMRPEAARALEEMFAACKEETGKTLISVSGYRSWAKQNRLYQRKLKSVKRNAAKAQEYVAPPGASEHQTGLAMDLGQRGKPTLGSNFGKTEGGQWIRENCWRFGFILRYDEGWEAVTGYKYEPWHVRYVGKEAAQEIHAANVPFETWLTDYRVRRLREILAGPLPGETEKEEAAETEPEDTGEAAEETETIPEITEPEGNIG